MVVHRLYKLQEADDDLCSTVAGVLTSQGADFDGSVELENCYYIDTGSEGRCQDE